PPSSSLFPYTTLFRSRSLVLKRLIGDQLLTGRIDVTGSGSAIFETGENIFANDVAEVVDELAEYPLTDTGDPTYSVFAVDKYGLDRKSTRLNSSHVKI